MGFFERIMGEEPSLWSQFWNYDNPGSFGEYMTSYALDNIAGYGKILRNIYLPYRGRTSEIDVLLIHEKGIFVFESKNYSGWIFGSADSSKWTQCLQSKEKHQFYNPIMQNRTHLKALMEYLSTGSLQNYHSYIIFSERCTLKKVPSNTDEYIIVRRPDMLSSLRRNLNNRSIVFSHEEIDAMQAKLIKLTNQSAEQKQQHIKEIEKVLAAPPTCPYCKTPMIERTASKGENAGNKFWGCKNYPRCKQTKPFKKD